MFTYQYKQPDEYHFSLDSIHLAEFVAEQLRLQPNLNTLRVMDLCAGCGVIGLELSWYLRDLRHFDFVEVQEIYSGYFQQNLTLVNRPELNCKWHVINYDTLLEKSWESTFDLIICNPPYFQPSQGILSPSEFKNRCRFYLDSTFTNLIRAMTHTLAPLGKAYCLLRCLKHHGYDPYLDMLKILKGTRVDAKKIHNIRGTDVILLEKS